MPTSPNPARAYGATTKRTQSSLAIYTKKRRLVRRFLVGELCRESCTVLSTVAHSKTGSACWLSPSRAADAADEGMRELSDYRNIGLGLLLAIFVIAWPNRLNGWLQRKPAPPRLR